MELGGGEIVTWTRKKYSWREFKKTCWNHSSPLMRWVTSESLRMLHNRMVLRSLKKKRKRCIGGTITIRRPVRYLPIVEGKKLT